MTFTALCRLSRVARRLPLFVTSLMVGGAMPGVVRAQLNGQNIKGDVGLKAGSQAPPGTYVAIPLYWYTADQVRNRDGDAILHARLTTFIGGVVLNHVTSQKLWGANYGFTIGLPWAKNRIQGTEIDVEAGGGGVTDMYVQPLNLGWHLKRADVTAGYGLFLPTGRYEGGAPDNTGLGMWGHEFSVGGTIFNDTTKTWHLATLATLDIQSRKEGSDVRVGNILNLEGGLGRDFLKGAVSTGVAYYATFKVSDDRLEGLPALLVRGRNRVFALGPEATFPITNFKLVYGFVTARYQWEFGARTATQGGAWNVLATFLTKPLKASP